MLFDAVVFTSMFFRSVLFVPGVRPDRFANAVGSGADAVVFDLEDSVDATRKSEAREAIGGVPGVLIAAYLVKSLPLLYIRWGVVIVVLYTAITMLRSAAKNE